MKKIRANENENKNKNQNRSNNYRTVDFYILLFFVLSGIGWLWEVMLYLVTQQEWINRGVLRGPYLPIYGFGGILLYLLLRSLRKKPLLVFVLSAAVCSIVEYAASYYLEWKWGIRWWDYSDYLLNLHGRICLIAAAAFGAGGTLLVCVLTPCFLRLYHRIPAKWRTIICILLIVCFAADAVYSAVFPNTGYGITQ